MKGILTIKPLYTAIVEGRKDQTRRVIKKLEYDPDNPNELGRVANNWFWKVTSMDFWSFSKYKVGERIYLKEPYWDFGYYHETDLTKAGYPKWISVLDKVSEKISYLYDGAKEPKYIPFVEGVNPPFPQWKKGNKYFMPENYARSFVDVISVRVERLQDITRSDIRAEGLQPPPELCSDDASPNYKEWLIEEWIKLWDSINKPPLFMG